MGVLEDLFGRSLTALCFRSNFLANHLNGIFLSRNIESNQENDAGSHPLNLHLEYTHVPNSGISGPGWRVR